MLKEIIKSKGFRQKWLAKKIGVSEVTLSNWVKQKAIPKKEHLEKLSAILDIPLDQLTTFYGK